MFAIVFGIFGLIVGSFLNVFILRRGVKPLSGRSSCMSCGRTIAWYDLIPVLSWIILLGRCRYCRTRISIQYPLVEAATGLAFALIGGALFPAGIFYKLIFCVIAGLLISIAVYDIHHTIIPDAWVYTFDALAFMMLFLFASTGLQGDSILLQFLAGPIAALPLYVLWLISSGRWMGLGDAKLALGMGWLLGPWIGLIAVMFSFILGSLILVPLLLITHMPGVTGRSLGLTMKSEVPFGPFLILSTFLLWFFLLYAIPLPIVHWEIPYGVGLL